jgi:hypothetical protein
VKGNELDTPTIAESVPMKNDWAHGNGFSATNASLNEAKIAYVKLNIQTPLTFAKATARQVRASWRWFARHSCQRRRVPVNSGRAWEFFHSVPSDPNFGHGCDCPAMPAFYAMRLLRRQYVSSQAGA